MEVECCGHCIFRVGGRGDGAMYCEELGKTIFHEKAHELYPNCPLPIKRRRNIKNWIEIKLSNKRSQ